MKRFWVLAAILVTIIGLSGCSGPNPIVGNWDRQSVIILGQTVNSYPASFEAKSDGSIIWTTTENGQNFNGTWKKTNSEYSIAKSDGEVYGTGSISGNTFTLDYEAGKQIFVKRAQ